MRLDLTYLIQKSDERFKNATETYDLIMAKSRNRIDTLAETRMKRRIDIMDRYIATIKKVQELSGVSGLQAPSTHKPNI